MREPPNDELRAERPLAITAAVLAGAMTVGVVLGALWGFGWLVMPPRVVWDPVVDAARPVALALGGGVVLVRLIHAR